MLFRVVILFSIPTSSERVFQLLHTLANIWDGQSFSFYSLTWASLILVVICISLRTDNVGPLLMCFNSNSVHSLGKFSFRSFAHSKNYVVCLLIKNLFINSSTRPLSCIRFANIFSLWLSFSLS